MTSRTAWTPGYGEVILVRMSPRRGEPTSVPGTCVMRAALVLSSADYSATTGRAIVCPVADVPKGNPFEVKIPVGPGAGGVILADRVTSIDVRACGVRLAGAGTNNAVTAVREKLLALVDTPLEQGGPVR